jgi:molybdopterin-guanine dinucleotide biosynthesis protein MobB
VVGDDGLAIEQQLLAAQRSCDAVITTGGAWGSERDLVVTVLERLGWRKLYHHVKLGPGKAAGCGLWEGKLAFCLPGGPPSSQMAFLQLALPALLKLAGHRQPQLPWLMAELSEDVTGQPDWTQFIEGRLEAGATGMRFHPRKMASRLQSMADAEGLVMIPSGTAAIRGGTSVPIQILPDVLTTTARPMAGPPAASPEHPSRTPAPPVVSFVAKSGTGKTTFLEQLIPELVARGLRVGVLKHHAHPTPFDVPGKDTYRLARAGAQVVVGACSVQVAVFRQEDGAANLEAVIARDLAGVDLVLTEGFKRGTYPKIEVHRSAHDPELLCNPGELLALVTDERLDVDVPQFALTDVAGVAAFLRDWARRGR